MGTVQKTYLKIQGKPVPAKVYHERRNNVRASIGKKAVILRMPLRLNQGQQKEQLVWFADWVEKQFAKDPHLHTRFFGRQYSSGDQINVGQKEYTLHFETTHNKTHHARLANGVIYLKLSDGDNPAHLQKSIKHLLSRVIGQDQLPQVTRRVNELNNMYFRQPVKSVNLKYNQSNWGSCSSKGNINLSTRLLFAPPEVIDYVIIHELAHLIELNHSDRFWKLVSDAMPDYKQKEEWLKRYGGLCQF
ncbi:MAG: M48 family metallopeptidase [Bacteroidota bacterium]